MTSRRPKYLLHISFLLLMIMLVIISCHQSTSTLFKKISTTQSNIHFNNVITESDSINPISTEFLYNGGGVSIADFNRDGLQDIYFTGGMVENKLYLNQGN